MVTKTRRTFVFSLLPIFVLMTAMRCGPIVPEDILELEGVKAFIVVTPHKEVYQIGDTVALSIKAEKSKWNNWAHFEKAFFDPHAIEVGGIYRNENIVALVDTALISTKASFVGRDWVVEQKRFFVLKQAKTYIFDYSSDSDLDVGTPYRGLYRGLWPVSYNDGKTYYSTNIPIYAMDGKQYIELKVE